MAKGYRTEVIYNQEASIAATVTKAISRGWGQFSQLGVRLNVGGVTGGADTFEFKIQTRLGNDWIDIITMTQATAAATETKWAIRTASVGWGDELRAVATVGAGATATVVDATIIGANA